MPNENLAAQLGSDPKQKELVFGVLRALERRPLTLADLRYVVAPPLDLETEQGFTPIEPLVNDLVKTGFVVAADKSLWKTFWPTKPSETSVEDETPLTLTPKANLWLHPPVSISGQYRPTS
jgi:hypothetical protein